MRRPAPAVLTLSLVLAGPASAAVSVAYAPGTNLERLDVEAIGRAEHTIELAAYVLTDVPVIDALGGRRQAGRARAGLPAA